MLIGIILAAILLLAVLLLAVYATHVQARAHVATGRLADRIALVTSPAVRAKVEEDRAYQMALASLAMQREKQHAELAIKQRDQALREYLARTRAQAETYLIDVEPRSITALPSLKPVAAAQIAAQVETRRGIPAPVDVARLLQSGAWQPSPLSLLLAVGPDGPVTVAYALAWHIALAGATGGGKTNELRLILAQMVLYHTVYYISPAFAPIKANHEDWRQIEARLAGHVARKGPEIAQRLQWATGELVRRQDAEAAGDFSWKARNIYIVIDEYKEVIARYEDAPNDVSTLLRQGRQYGIFAVVAAQDFLIKSIGGDSGARDCYRTALYFGGDPYTCRSLLDVSGTLPYEEELGKEGHLVLRTKSTKTSQARAPFMSNRAIYMLLGWPDDPILDDGPIGRGAGEHGRADQWPSGADFQARQDGVVDADEMPVSRRNTGELETAFNQPIEQLGGSPDIRPDYPLMNDQQVQRFLALYPILGTEKALDEIPGCNHRHRQHARELIRQHGLERKY